MANVVFKSTGSRVPPPDLVARYAAGEVIFRQGDLGTDMYIIHEGQVEIVTGDGERENVVAVLEKGDFFGEMSLLDEQPRSATARAATDVRLLTIDGTTFGKMLRDNTEIAVRMMRKLARRLRETDRMLQDALADPEAAGPVMPTPDAAPAPAPGPERLVHSQSGMDFHLSSGSETTIGRSDPVTGIEPDVDLTPVDAQRSISRRHAKIYRRGGKYFLAEEIGTVNGTFAAGDKLETGVPREIVPGDELRFGLVTVTFHTE